MMAQQKPISDFYLCWNGQYFLCYQQLHHSNNVNCIRNGIMAHWPTLHITPIKIPIRHMVAICWIKYSTIRESIFFWWIVRFFGKHHKIFKSVWSSRSSTRALEKPEEEKKLNFELLSIKREMKSREKVF